MQSVVDFQELLREIAVVRDLKKGFITNFYPDEKKHLVWIRHQVLYYEWIEEVLFLVKRNKDFCNLFYCASGVEELERALAQLCIKNECKDVLLDLVGTKAQCDIIKKVFVNLQFKEYCSLVRMSKQTLQEQLELEDSDVCFATIDETELIYQLLQEYFDPRAEQLPFEEEIRYLTGKQRILVCKENSRIVGFLIYELNRSTLYLRYWFVHPEYRDKKVGSSLIRRFFYEGRETKRQLFWVMCSNNNAIKRYRHYGFIPENLYDYVLILK